jgi:hypothetical protein
MGQAKARGTREDRIQQALAQGRQKTPRVPTRLSVPSGAMLGAYMAIAGAFIRAAKLP